MLSAAAYRDPASQVGLHSHSFVVLVNNSRLRVHVAFQDSEQGQGGKAGCEHESKWGNEPTLAVAGGWVGAETAGRGSWLKQMSRYCGEIEAGELLLVSEDEDEPREARPRPPKLEKDIRPLIGRGCRALPPSVALCLPYATGSAAEAVPRAAAIGLGAGGQPLPPTGRLSFQPRRLCHHSFTLGSSPFEPPGHYSQEKYSSQAHENYFLA
ncbi:hypothetical protein B0H14DRAFT_3142566 [Mycena olivaceomarginata]|nr:hypothetical protein B0H14DRAFT_3142566 [Mycena olivaceomarginata]